MFIDKIEMPRLSRESAIQLAKSPLFQERDYLQCSGSPDHSRSWTMVGITMWRAKLELRVNGVSASFCFTEPRRHQHKGLQADLIRELYRHSGIGDLPIYWNEATYPAFIYFKRYCPEKGFAIVDPELFLTLNNWGKRQLEKPRKTAIRDLSISLEGLTEEKCEKLLNTSWGTLNNCRNRLKRGKKLLGQA